MPLRFDKTESVAFLHLRFGAQDICDCLGVACPVNKYDRAKTHAP